MLNPLYLAGPTLAKIDVERHEPQVFRSLAPCIESRICKVIVIENHNSETKALDSIKAFVEPLGYRIYGIVKAVWSTKLVSTKEHISKATNYAIIRNDLAIENKRIANLIVRNNIKKTGLLIKKILT